MGSELVVCGDLKAEVVKRGVEFYEMLLEEREDVEGLTGVTWWRFWNCCLINHYQGELFSEEVYYEVDVERFATLAGLRIDEAYVKVKEVAEKIKSTNLTIKLDKITWCTSFIYDFMYIDETKEIKIQWNKKIIPLISGHMEAGRFAYCDARLDKLQSSRVYRLADYIHQHLYLLQRKQEFSLETSKLREIAIAVNTYTRYAEFDRNLLKPAVKALAEICHKQLEYKGSKTKVTFWRKK